MRYELSKGTSHKFWAITRDGKKLVITYGRIGTDGQSIVKSFASPELAAKEEAKLVGEKTRKGYASVGKGANAAPARAKATPALDEKSLLKPIGRVWSESNYVALVAVDGAAASAYRYPFDESEKGHLDFDETIDGPLPVGKTKGLILSVSSSGYVDVYRFGDAFVMVDFATGEDDIDAEAAQLRAFATHPTTKPKKIGTVDLPSGVLVLIGSQADGPKVDLAKVKKSGAMSVGRLSDRTTPSGTAIAVPPGRYEIWREEFGAKPPRGDWGIMEGRTRIVPAGTKVSPGKPILELAPAPKAHTPSGGLRRLVDPKFVSKSKKKWQYTRRIDVAADGRVVAGQDEALGAALWNGDGALAWQVDLGVQKTFGAKVSVQFAGEDVLALAGSAKELLVLDPANGKVRRKLRIPESQHFRVFEHEKGDMLLALHHDNIVVVLAYPSLKPVARLAAYTNSLELAPSPDGRWFASTTDDEVNIYDMRGWKLHHTIGGDVTAVGFTNNSQLLMASRKSEVRLLDPKTKKIVATFDAAADRAKKPSIEGFACTNDIVAISRVDGTLALFDAKTRKLVKQHEKHVTQRYFGPPVAFAPDGKTVWIGACPKGTPVGVSGYAVP